MKKPSRFLVLTCLAVMAAFAPAVGGDAASSLTAHANAAMAKYLAAFKRKDMRACEAVLRANYAKDFKHYDMKGKVRNLEEVIQQEKMQMSMVQKVSKATLKLSDVKVKGNSATGKGSFVMDAIIGNPQNPKETHKLHVDAKWSAKMKKVGGTWWVSEERATSEKILIDGKALPPM